MELSSDVIMQNFHAGRRSKNQAQPSTFIFRKYPEITDDGPIILTVVTVMLEVSVSGIGEDSEEIEYRIILVDLFKTTQSRVETLIVKAKCVQLTYLFKCFIIRLLYTEKFLY